MDAAFCGYRAAAGRNARIRKGAYYFKAMLKGWIFGQVAIAATFCLAYVLWSQSADAQVLAISYLVVARTLVRTYEIYGFVIALAFLLRLLPSADSRSVTNTLIFGPGTFLRPYVVTAGVVFAVWSAPELSVFFLATAALVAFLSLQSALEHTYAPKHD
jgi:hypothetical protein